MVDRKKLAVSVGDVIEHTYHTFYGADGERGTLVRQDANGEWWADFTGCDGYVETDGDNGIWCVGKVHADLFKLVG